jgi:hypothetical protein
LKKPGRQRERSWQNWPRITLTNADLRCPRHPGFQPRDRPNVLLTNVGQDAWEEINDGIATPAGQSLFVSVTLHGHTSNKVSIRMK